MIEGRAASAGDRSSRYGVDNIDVDAATRHGIMVVNAPTGNAIAVAEHTIALMMALARNVPQADRSLRAGHWDKKSLGGVEVRDKTLGIVGLGRAGSAVAKRAIGLEMVVIAYDPFVTQDYASRLNVRLVSFDELISRADFVSLHAPATDQNRGMIGARELQMMKPTARLVNSARGELVDEDALLQALNSGEIAGAALDVFAAEPPEGSPLLEHPRVIVTPHLGASTQEAQRNVALKRRSRSSQCSWQIAALSCQCAIVVQRRIAGNVPLPGVGRPAGCVLWNGGGGQPARARDCLSGDVAERIRR